MNSRTPKKSKIKRKKKLKDQQLKNEKSHLDLSFQVLHIISKETIGL
jgi:hypothetical protein